MIINYKNFHPSLHEPAFIAPNATIIGQVTLGKDSNIWYNSVIRGDARDVIIGERTNIQDLSMIHVATFGSGTYIGDDVTIGHCAILHACRIGNLAYIGMQSCLLDDAVVEDNAMLGAGSLLTSGKIVKSGELWAGRPAKFMRYLTQKDYDMIDWSAKNYVELAKSHNASLHHPS